MLGDTTSVSEERMRGRRYRHGRCDGDSGDGIRATRGKIDSCVSDHRGGSVIAIVASQAVGEYHALRVDQSQPVKR
jgi:hypothetical protein